MEGMNRYLENIVVLRHGLSGVREGLAKFLKDNALNLGIVPRQLSPELLRRMGHKGAELLIVVPYWGQDSGRWYVIGKNSSGL
jgi:hypothetical protein